MTDAEKIKALKTEISELRVKLAGAEMSSADAMAEVQRLRAVVDAVAELVGVRDENQTRL